MKKNNTHSSEAAELRGRAEERLKERQSSRRSKDGDQGAAEETQKLIQELQIHQIELEMQNEELRRMRAEVEKLLRQYTDLYDFAPVGYFTLDRDGKIQRGNLIGARLLGEERARIVNRRFGLFVSPADRPTFNDFLKKVFTNQAAVSPDKASCEVTLGREDDRLPSPTESRYLGEAGRLHVHIEAQATEDGQECRALVADITKRKQAEAALYESHAKLERNLKGTIDVISEMVEEKGPNGPGHHQRVSALASAIAKEMGLTDFQVQGIELAADVYDIGLMNIPTEILRDTDRLVGVKLTLYQGYPKTGHDTLKKIEFPWLIADIILQHRECFNGSGFPQGIKGADILIEARVLAVADAVVGLTTNRAYRNALSLEEAQDGLLNDRGSRFDPAVVDACLRLFREKRFGFE